jgi:hypothetical protein
LNVLDYCNPVPSTIRLSGPPENSEICDAALMRGIRCWLAKMRDDAEGDECGDMGASSAPGWRSGTQTETKPAATMGPRAADEAMP